ncbi:MAG: DUF177 domain-containing protein [Syntrophomonadaceae bacterium]|nr:DUF177 domain-containing protein [Syntrophomonadaceae bacterium]
MQIDLSWLKLHPKSTEEFHLEKDYSGLELIQGVRLFGRVEVSLTITNTGRLMVGQGEIKSGLEMDCDRCLGIFHQEIKLPMTVEFCTEENRVFFEDEESFIYFEDPKINLEPVVQDNILLSLPLRMLCSAECLGLCSRCGQNLNQGKCQCRDDEIDPRWEALKKML